LLANPDSPRLHANALDHAASGRLERGVDVLGAGGSDVSKLSPEIALEQQSSVSMSHLPAGIRTAVAQVGAAAHFLIVVGHLLALVAAALADFGADAAGERVQIGAADHEIGAGVADLGAIGEQPDVVPLRVPSALPQAMLDGADADRVALGAIVDAGLQVLLGHGSSVVKALKVCPVALAGNGRICGDGGQAVL